MMGGEVGEVWNIKELILMHSWSQKLIHDLYFSLIQFLPLLFYISVHMATYTHTVSAMKCWHFETVNYPLAREDTCC